MTVVDVDEASFQREVLDRSRDVPVVVDFWAEWCGPCRMLGPVLESAADSRAGKVVLAKLDTDANPGLSQSYGIRGIPAVKAFRDGEVVDEFVGAAPPAAVERFFDSLVPSAAEQLVEQGDEATLREALELEPGRADAALALARVLLDRDEPAEALSVLEPVRGSFQADGLAARIHLLDSARANGGDDVRVARAFAALDLGDVAGGLELLLGELETSEGDTREWLRQAIVAQLEQLGVDDPLARESRRRLAAVLY